MRYLTSILLVIFFSNSLKAQNTAPASVILEKAFTQAKTENKKVFVIFHASWCVWCHKMDTAMNDAVCKDLFQRKYVISHLTTHESKNKKNLENPGADSLFKQYAPTDSGIPFWMIYDNNQKIITTSAMPNGKNSGCPASQPEVSFFISALKNSSDLNEKELQVIETRFRKNEGQ